MILCAAFIKSKAATKSLAIQYYLKGLTRDRIAKEVGLSTGTVSNTIRDWETSIGLSHALDIRDFAVMVKKSGMSIEQCVQGFRMVQLLKNLGIWKINEVGGWDYDDAKEISSFIQVIHRNCKKLGIPPEIVPTWIRDLLDCYSHNINNSAQSSNRNFPESVSNTSATGMGPESSNNKSTNSSSGFEIPYMSQITDFISQKKKECLRLEKDRQLINKDIVGLELQKY